MDDRLRETLSAMMDDEADELSVRRLLSHDDQPEVLRQWQRWQQVRDLVHSGQSQMDSIDVCAGADAPRAGRDRQAPDRTLAVAGGGHDGAGPAHRVWSWCRLGSGG